MMILQFPGSIYAIETRNPGPKYAKKFFQLFFCKHIQKKNQIKLLIKQIKSRFGVVLLTRTGIFLDSETTVTGFGLTQLTSDITNQSNTYDFLED